MRVRLFTIITKRYVTGVVRQAINRGYSIRQKWRSQAVKSEWAHGAPSGRSMGGPWEKSDIYRQFVAVRCFSIRRFVAESVLRLNLPPSPPKKTSHLRESHEPTRPGQGGHGAVPTRGYALCVRQNSIMSIFLRSNCIRCFARQH